MDAEQRKVRIKELEGSIRKAERELHYLGAGRSLNTELRHIMADISAGEDFFSRTTSLCVLLTEGLNALNESMEGEVSLRSDSLTIDTATGVISYDPDSREWSFQER